MFEREEIDVLGMSEIHLKGCGVTDGRDEDEEGAMGGTRGRNGIDRDRRRRREGWMCSNGLPKSMGRNRWALMAWIENSVDDGEDRNGEMCMGVCVCSSE